MPRGTSRPPPSKRRTSSRRTLGILELDRFSEESLTRWNALSKDLDELQAVLYFGVLPEQRRLRPELIETLMGTPPRVLAFTRWSRVVTFQYSTEPLSAAGSLHAYGGRFNAGIDLDPGTLDPWPALYLAEDPETALREKFQMAATEDSGGLSRDELALTGAQSYASVAVSGEPSRLFDMTSPVSLQAVAKVLGRIRMPVRAREIGKRLGLTSRDLWMVKTGRQPHAAALTQNWRTLPVQFGLPAPSHTLAELIRAAGFEGILFRSTKSAGHCVAVFPELLASGSFVQLADRAPAAVRHGRLDPETADALAGWESLASKRRR